MSNKIVNAIRPLVMSPAQKFVLTCLADEANDQGVCWPSVAAIVEKTCMGERTVRRAIADLEDMHLVVADRRSGRSTSYDLSPAMASAAQVSIPLPERQGCQSGRGARAAKTPAAAAPTPAAAAPHPCQSGTPILDPPEIPQGSTTTSDPGWWRQFELAYPNKAKLAEARPLWEALSEADRQLALAVVRDQVGKPQWQREGFRFVPAADKWLRRREFEKYPNPMARRGAAPNEPGPAPLSAEARAAGAEKARAAKAALTGRAA